MASLIIHWKTHENYLWFNVNKLNLFWSWIFVFSSKSEHTPCGMGNIYVIFCPTQVLILAPIFTMIKLLVQVAIFLFTVLCKGFDFPLMVFLWKWYVGRYPMRKTCLISGKISSENWFEPGSISWLLSVYFQVKEFLNYWNFASDDGLNLENMMINHYTSTSHDGIQYTFLHVQNFIFLTPFCTLFSKEQEHSWDFSKGESHCFKQRILTWLLCWPPYHVYF